MMFYERDMYIGRSLKHYGEFCPSEGQVYRQILRPGQTVVDAGANIGCFTLLFANAVGPGGVVHAFEPQRVLHQMLCGNVAMNGHQNVVAHRAGLSDQVGEAQVPPISYGGDTNLGGLALAQEGRGEPVPLMPIDALDLAGCALIKADVQGMEGALLDGAKSTIARHRPTLSIENDLRDQSPALIERLLALDYAAYWWPVPLYQAENFRENRVNVFPNVRCVNLFCLPKERTTEIRGLRPVSGPEDWISEPAT